MNSENQLLPKGFYDTLPPEAVQESKTIATLLKYFASFGYEQVKPPLIESAAGLLSGQGETLVGQTFRFMDPASGETLAIRADMTGQVARIVATRFKDAPKPLRLSYAGQVIRAQGEGLHRERQLAQAGIELIGSDSVASKAEVVQVAIEALEHIGMGAISVDFSFPQLSTIIMDNYDIAESERPALFHLIETKDEASIRQAGADAAPLLISLINSAGNAETALRTIRALDMPQQAGDIIAQLSDTLERIRAVAPSIALTVDPLERHGFEYHTGVSFSLFSVETSEEIGRGGSYRIGQAEDAVGFSLSLNAILRALPEKAGKQKIFVPFDTAPDAGIHLREKGLVTLHGLEETPDPETEATRLGCAFLYRNGEIVTV